MISFSQILREVLTERMSFRALLAGSEGGRKERGRQDVNARPIRVTTIDGLEAWTFRYKSDPSSTGNPWHGFIQFFKDDVSQKDNAEDLDCMVDCDCPDYRYRFAYNNAQADAGRVGKSPDWKHGNQNNGQKWRPRSQGGVGDYGVGLCKHLCALSEFLKTNVSTDAPEPDDKPPVPKKKPITKPVPPSVAPQTTQAPDPDNDSYTDSRTGSDTLTEGISNLYRKIDAFSKSNPEFTVMYEDHAD
jgi:hypothetical protein